VIRDVALPPLQIAHEPSGLTLLALQRRAVPLFHARLTVPAGAAEDPRGKAGLAQFTVELLRRGTMRRDARGVDELIESMGTGLGIEVALDEAALTLTVPGDLSRQALDALLEVALEPSFPEEEVASARRRALASLQSDLDEPTSVAARAVVTLGYGAHHPYGHPAHGFRRDVETFQREDALGFHASRFNARGALLALVGTDPPEKLLDLARSRLSQVRWPSEARRAPLDFAALPREGMRALVWHKPDSTQAQVRIVATGIPRRSPLYMPGVVENTALGGGFTSLLVDAIRVDRGLSYSVSTRLAMARHAGLSVFSSFTKNETLRELVDVALEKMREYARTGPSKDALEKARSYLAGLFPLGLESNEALAEQVADAILDGLGLEHLATYRSRVGAVTAAQARDAAAQLSPSRDGAQILVIGDGEVGRKALADLCPVDVRPIEELA